MKSRVLLPIALLIVGVASGWLLGRFQFRQTPVQLVAGPAETVAEAPPRVPGDSPLDMLDWLVGDWVDASDNASIEFNCHFTKNDAFLLRSFKVINAKNVSFSGMQLVAWDATKEAIRSWTYDSQGGFGEETWTQAGNRYTLRCKYTLPDGGTGSNLQVVTFIDNDTFTWKSVNREIDGEFQPDTEEITLVRKPVIDDTQGAK